MLIIVLIFQVFGAFYGGITLVIDPSGNLLQMPLSNLEGSPFKDYLFPGLILLFLLGVFPAFVAYSLIKKPTWKWANKLNIYKDQHWAWTYSLYVSIMLIIWIDVQIMLIGYGAPIQIVYAFLGIILLVLTLMPQTKNYYLFN